MSTGVHHGSPQVSHPSRKAWAAAAFIPVAFVVAMVLGEGLLSWQGYESGDDQIPFGVLALAGGSALLVLEAPCVAAFVLGRRAIAEGDPDGKAPAWIGAILGVLFLAQNLAAFLFG
jgi:hypothetical protein